MTRRQVTLLWFSGSTWILLVLILSRFFVLVFFFFFSSRRRHTRCYRDWSSDVCSSDLRGRIHPLCCSDGASLCGVSAATCDECPAGTTKGIICAAGAACNTMGGFAPGSRLCHCQ